MVIFIFRKCHQLTPTEHRRCFKIISFYIWRTEFSVTRARQSSLTFELKLCQLRMSAERPKLTPKVGPQTAPSTFGKEQLWNNVTIGKLSELCLSAALLFLGRCYCQKAGLFVFNFRYLKAGV